jgi:tRNA threonylcarbamoyladenosine biosynthesis protein TsaB
MILLVTDTSGKNGTVALAHASADNSSLVEVLEVASLAGGAFSAQLVPQIAALLTRHGLTKFDVDAFIVVSGPGSFTGLRVGLAAIKALAEILRRPIAAVSLLEALALSSGAEGKIVSVLDAGRGEVYGGEYLLADASAHLLAETLLSRDAFLTVTGPIAVATADQDLAALARNAGLSVCQVEPVTVEAIAQLGWRKLQSGQSVSPEQLEANYVRGDTEIFAKSGS